MTSLTPTKWKRDDDKYVPAHMFIWVIYSAPIRSIGFNKIDQMDSKIGFEISLIVVEGIRGRCASFMLLTATVSEIFGGQTNSPILVV